MASNLVLTAGHCAADETTGTALDPIGYRVVTGAVDWIDQANRQISDVSQVIVYPTFNPTGPTNDAALLVLSSPVNDATIPLWSSGTLLAGTAAWIAGWGSTYAGEPAGSPTVLQWAPTVVQSTTYCGQVASREYYPYSSSTVLCAVNPPTDDTGTCNGDSGGPLLARDASGNLFEIGLTSVGPTDCNTQTADYFTAILPIESWIQNEATAVRPSSGTGSTPSGSAPPPSGPATAGNGSSAGPAPAAPPTMILADARSYVQQVLAHLFKRFRSEHALKLSCARRSAIRVKCGFTFWSGPNDYWGSVTVHYYIGSDRVTYWASSYKTRWVNDHCYFHTTHPGSCSVRLRTGSW